MENLRGIGLMVASMAGFAIADMFIKLVSGGIPVGEILLLIGLGGTIIFALWSALTHDPVFGADFFSPVILMKNFGEIIGTFGFVTALALTPISSASAILQATPLAVTLGAALFMQEAVGWRRWSAIAVGFTGVLLVIRPGFESFQTESLFAVLAVVGLSIRDLATRAAPKEVSSLRMGTYGFFAIVLSGIAILIQQDNWVTPNLSSGLSLSVAVIFDVMGYYALTLAMRQSDVSLVTPFRYTRILFATAIGITVFGEVLDFWMVLGSAIIILSGLYTFAREHRQRKAN